MNFVPQGQVSNLPLHQLAKRDGSRHFGGLGGVVNPALSERHHDGAIARDDPRGIGRLHGATDVGAAKRTYWAGAANRLGVSRIGLDDHCLGRTRSYRRVAHPTDRAARVRAGGDGVDRGLIRPRGNLDFSPRHPRA